MISDDFYDENYWRDFEHACMYWCGSGQKLFYALRREMTREQIAESDKQAHIEFVATMRRRLISMPPATEVMQ